jgi:hypothetical protein
MFSSHCATHTGNAKIGKEDSIEFICKAKVNGLRNCRLAFEAKILFWIFEQLDSENGELGFKVFEKGEK